VARGRSPGRPAARRTRRRRAETLVVVTADHGEAFGEHGEIGHSLFVYDTTLRVPLILAGPRGGPRRCCRHPVSLVDIATDRAGGHRVAAPDRSMARSCGMAECCRATAPRQLYAETSAPFEDFGWSPLRSVRAGTSKYILAPTPEFYDLAADAGETTNLAAARQADAAAAQGQRWRTFTAELRAPAPAGAVDTRSPRRLQALGYLGDRRPHSAQGTPLADPKDRRALAARLAEVTSGELTGAALEAALDAHPRRRSGEPAGGAAPRLRARGARRLPRGRRRTFARPSPPAVAHCGSRTSAWPNAKAPQGAPRRRWPRWAGR
jgi:hypothetical protein